MTSKNNDPVGDKAHGVTHVKRNDYLQHNGAAAVDTVNAGDEISFRYPWWDVRAATNPLILGTTDGLPRVQFSRCGHDLAMLADAIGWLLANDHRNPALKRCGGWRGFLLRPLKYRIAFVYGADFTFVRPLTPGAISSPSANVSEAVLKRVVTHPNFLKHIARAQAAEDLI